MHSNEDPVQPKRKKKTFHKHTKEIDTRRKSGKGEIDILKKKIQFYDFKELYNFKLFLLNLT